MVSPVTSTNPVNSAYQTQQLHHQPPAKPANSHPTESTPQEDKVQLSSAAKGASGDVNHHGGKH
jgi:hypothetical protein